MNITVSTPSIKQIFSDIMISNIYDEIKITKKLIGGHGTPEGVYGMYHLYNLINPLLLDEMKAKYQNNSNKYINLLLRTSTSTITNIDNLNKYYYGVIHNKLDTLFRLTLQKCHQELKKHLDKTELEIFIDSTNLDFYVPI